MNKVARLVWFGRCLCGSDMAKIKEGERVIAACTDDGCLMRNNSYVTAAGTADAMSDAGER